MPAARFRGRALTAVAMTAVVSATVSGCFGGGSDLSESDFTSGVCRTSAESIIDIDQAVRQLQGEDTKPEDVLESLKKAQASLRTARDGAEETLRQQITDLTDAIGIFRIGVDSGTVGADQAEGIATALEPVVATCTTN